jgi:hypothetical protein
VSSFDNRCASGYRGAREMKRFAKAFYASGLISLLCSFVAGYLLSQNPAVCMAMKGWEPWATSLWSGVLAVAVIGIFLLIAGCAATLLSKHNSN